MHEVMIEKHELSASVRKDTTYREFRRILVIGYCMYTLHLIAGKRTVNYPARLFYLYGKLISRVENLLEDFEISLYEEFRKKT